MRIWSNARLQTNMKQIEHDILIKNPNWQEADQWSPVCYLQSRVELSSGLQKKNPASGREEDLPRCKSSALTTRACLFPGVNITLKLAQKGSYPVPKILPPFSGLK